MGVQNRQRRAAKQRRRAGRSTRGVGGGRRREPFGAPPDERAVCAELVWAAVDELVGGSLVIAVDLLRAVDAAPPVFGAVLDDAVAQQDALVRRHGWTDADLAEVRRRRLTVPAGASTAEVGVRWLAVLAALPPLPAVAPAAPASAGAGASGADDAMLAKIRALLAKAESTTFPEEAEALSAKAQELMARHRIDRVLLDPDGVDDVTGRRIWLDDPYATAKARLLSQVATANRCRAVVLGDLGCAHVLGFAADLEVVELLHTSLLVQATAAMAAAGPQRDPRGRSRTRSFRQSFLLAYAARIGERLAATATATEEAVAAEPGRSGLLPAIVRRDERVSAAMRAAFPRATTVSSSITNAAGWRAGTLAAERADLSAGPGLDR
ncbi:MAG TPA: DUF2786 domain-containing protein [Acidimicrobiales bacterium]|nr:DUF2786 domain-containing protein [Acidimicrobiales bacterium]